MKSEDVDTVGGLVFHLLGRMPALGDEVYVGGLRLQVLSVEGHRVKRLRAILEEKPSEAEGNGGIQSESV